jgi:hypothetical protein
MTRWAIDPRIPEQGRSLACAVRILRGKIDPCRQLPIAGRNIEATDYAVDDSPNVLNRIVRARRQSRALSREKIAPYVETIRTYQFACEVPILAQWRLKSELRCRKGITLRDILRWSAQKIDDL